MSLDPSLRVAVGSAPSAVIPFPLVALYLAYGCASRDGRSKEAAELYATLEAGLGRSHRGWNKSARKLVRACRSGMPAGILPFQRSEIDILVAGLALPFEERSGGVRFYSAYSRIEAGYFRVQQDALTYVSSVLDCLPEDAKYPECLPLEAANTLLRDWVGPLDARRCVMRTPSDAAAVLSIAGAAVRLIFGTESERHGLVKLVTLEGGHRRPRVLGPARLKRIEEQELGDVFMGSEKKLELQAASVHGMGIVLDFRDVAFVGVLPDLTEEHGTQPCCVSLAQLMSPQAGILRRSGVEVPIAVAKELLARHHWCVPTEVMDSFQLLRT